MWSMDFIPQNCRMAGASASSTSLKTSTEKAKRSRWISRCRPCVLSERLIGSFNGAANPRRLNVTTALNISDMPWPLGRKKHGICLMFIQPGNPQQNAYVERYNRTVRYDWLNQHMFMTIDEAQSSATQWLWTYNNERPNMAIGGITPAQKLERHMKHAA